MDLYSNKSSTPKWNAQRNLEGRTHYVDDATLKFHKSRILMTAVCDDGLMFALVESVGLDMHSTKRGFRHVIFDVFGEILSRPDLDDCKSTRRAAERELWAEIDKMDAAAITEAAICRRHAQCQREFSNDLAELVAMTAKEAA